MHLKYSNFSKIRAKKATIHNNLKIPALSLACNHHSWISCGIGQTSGQELSIIFGISYCLVFVILLLFNEMQIK